MTRIQLRRDTAANWSTINPTPSAGEPCFETDTGRFKIGDGSTDYNSLPYQGGTSKTAVTTDTAQTISGEKTFTNDIIIDQWNSNVSPIRETHIDLSNGNRNAFISADGVDRAFGMYNSSDTGIQLGTDKFDYTKGLSIKPYSLTFKNFDGTVTDLLAGGSGDATSTGNNTFTGTNIFKGKSLNVGDDNGYSNIASFTGASYIVGDQKDTTIINPLELGASSNNTVLKSNVRVLETDTASATKKAYNIMTKSPTNNEYMSGMGMPSDKHINLELGASGSTYTAPKSGYFFIEKVRGTGDYITAFNTNSKITYIAAVTQYPSRLLTPCIKGDMVRIDYNLTGNTTAFMFVYAQGSK